MLELQLIKGSLFENVLEAIVDLVNQASVNCSASTGFSLMAVDTKSVAILSLLFPSEVFQHYRCDEDCSMGIAIADMVKALRCANDDDIITIKADDSNYNDITLTFESPKKNCTADYDLRLVDAERHRVQIPDWQDLDSKYQAIIRMPSAEFMHSCKHLSSIGDDVVISVTKEDVTFFASGQSGCLSIVYRQNETLDKSEEATATLVDMREPISLIFDLSYMNSCAKAFALFDQVTICLSTTVPMMVEYKIKEKGYIRYFMAPKVEIEIEEEEERKTENEEAGTEGNKTRGMKMQD
ncbi:unnamed protein product [Urochloa decumbens]|uniref:DNA sliding clamp PCNA n=1 Tax=Urochloa decumbens TaxID=240449 RepID=A0ABC8ZXN1_9POAL